MVDQTVVGPQTTTSFGQGSTVNMRSGQLGELIVQELHGRYYESSYRGAMFNAANQAAVTTTVGLATTYTGLVLSNPITSVVNLAVNKCSVMQSVIQATQVEAFGLAIGFNGTTNVTHTTPVTPQASLVGSNVLVNGKVDSSATLPTAPFYYGFVTATPSATSDSTVGMIDLEGSVILKPGAYILWVTPTQVSVATSMWFSFQWEEVPV